MYQFIRPLLFTLEPERAHYFALKSLALAYRFKLTKLFKQPLDAPQQLLGLTFKNKIGLSAGFDRNGEYIDALAELGFGHIEIGTIVPEPQVGNPKPRIFRIPEQEALLNRVGFASKGLAYVVERLKRIKYKGVLGINIGKNKTTPNERALGDYQLGFRAFAHYASYITINLSSPNTQGLRDLLRKDLLFPLLQGIKKEQALFLKDRRRYVPFLLKISPDLDETQLTDLIDIVTTQQIDGIISANTTLDRSCIGLSTDGQQAGGISGRPLTEKNQQLIMKLRANLGAHFPIIASGGVMDEISAQALLTAGADLLQVYTGLIYQGPSLIRRLGEI